MERETVIANLRAELDYSAEFRFWLREYASNEWFAHSDQFLFEFSGTWREIFAETVAEHVSAYFESLGLVGTLRPEVRIGDSYRGSFIVEAYLVLATGIPAAYVLLKSIADLPDIADGLERLKDRMSEEYQARSNDVAFHRLHEAFRNARTRHNEALVASPPQPAPLPRDPLRGSFTIDARPLRALHPEEPVAHRVHLSVALTHDALSIENLGDEPMRAVRIGLFVNDAEQHSWSYADAYTSAVNILSARQTLSKELSDFRHHSGTTLAIGNTKQKYVDCWIQDEHGIYLFNFVLPP